MTAKWIKIVLEVRDQGPHFRWRANVLRCFKLETLFSPGPCTTPLILPLGLVEFHSLKHRHTTRSRERDLHDSQTAPFVRHEVVANAIDIRVRPHGPRTQPWLPW